MNSGARDAAQTGHKDGEVGRVGFPPETKPQLSAEFIFKQCRPISSPILAPGISFFRFNMFSEFFIKDKKRRGRTKTENAKKITHLS